jgi:hypothetical protein
MKTCSICNVSKPINQFYKKLKGTTHRCIDCEAAYQKKYYIKNRQKRIEAAKKNSEARIQTMKNFLVEHLKNNPCVDCGEDDILVLQFDHMRDKEYDVSTFVTGKRPRSFDTLKKEVAKCEIRCANCHQRKTAKAHNYWKLKYIVP